MFMISGRDSDADDDTVKVKAGEMTDITIGEKSLSGITSTLTEHNINVLQIHHNLFENDNFLFLIHNLLICKILIGNILKVCMSILLFH